MRKADAQFLVEIPVWKLTLDLAEKRTSFRSIRLSLSDEQSRRALSSFSGEISSSKMVIQRTGLSGGMIISPCHICRGGYFSTI